MQITTNETRQRDYTAETSRTPWKYSAKGLLPIFILLALNAEPQPISAAQVTYWFSGYVERVNNPSNALPFNVTIGMPFAGRVTYDTALVSLEDVHSYPAGDVGSYYFNSVAGLSAMLQIAGHTITNTADPSGFAGAMGLYDQYNDEDSLWMEAGKRLSIDGTPFLSPPYFSVISLFLSDDSKTAFNSVALPTNAPALASFAENREFTWGAYRDDGGPTRLFSVEGVLTSITSSEQVLLNYRPLPPDSAQLAWPASVSGFILQSSTNLATASWQDVPEPVVDVNGEHTVTVPAAGTATFFRLKK